MRESSTKTIAHPPAPASRPRVCVCGGVGFRSLKHRGPNLVFDLGRECRSRPVASAAGYSAMRRFAWKMESNALAAPGLPNLSYARPKVTLRVTGVLMGYGNRRAGGRTSTVRSTTPTSGAPPATARSAKLTPLGKMKLAGAHHLRPYDATRPPEIRILKKQESGSF